MSRFAGSSSVVGNQIIDVEVCDQKESPAGGSGTVAEEPKWLTPLNSIA
jgi:hypothetical protein